MVLLLVTRMCVLPRAEAVLSPARPRYGQQAIISIRGFPAANAFSGRLARLVTAGLFLAVAGVLLLAAEWAGGLGPGSSAGLSAGAPASAGRLGPDVLETHPSEVLGHSRIVLTADPCVSVPPDAAHTAVEKVTDLIITAGCLVPGTRRAAASGPAQTASAGLSGRRRHDPLPDSERVLVAVQAAKHVRPRRQPAIRDPMDLLSFRNALRWPCAGTRGTP
jgi:hypothetical protein